MCPTYSIENRRMIHSIFRGSKASSVHGFDGPECQLKMITTLKAQLRHRPIVRRIAANSTWLLVDRSVRMLIGIVLTVWVARYLGKSDFGLLNFCIACLALLGPITTIGMRNILIKALIEHPAQSGTLVGTALILRFGAASLALVAGLASLHLWKGDSRLLMIAIPIALTTFPRLTDVFEQRFQAELLAKPMVVASLVGALAAASLRAGCILLELDVVWIVWGDLLAVSIGCTVLALHYFRFTGSEFRSWRFNRSWARTLLAESWPQMLSGIAIVVYMKLDQIMLEALQGRDAVGVYSAALRFSEFWYFVPTVIFASAFPRIVQLRSEDTVRYHKRLQQTFEFSALAALAIAIPVTLLGPMMMRLFYGSAFHGAGTILAIHVWTTLFVFWGVAQEPWNTAEGLLRQSLVRTLLGAVVNAMLNLILIPRFGPAGAAVGTLISYAFAATFSNLLLARTRCMFWMQISSLRILLRPWQRLRSMGAGQGGYPD